MPVITKADVKTPSITIGGIEMSCHGRQIQITLERTPSMDTWCSKGVTGKLVNAFFQSWGVDGTEAVLRPLVNSTVEIIFNPGGEAVIASVDNPIVRGTAIVPPFDFVNVEPGDDDQGVTLIPITFSFIEGSLEKTIDDLAYTPLA